MLYTSYFAKLKKLPKHIIPISICGKAPAWYTGLQYKKLAPKYHREIKKRAKQSNKVVKLDQRILDRAMEDFE